MLENDVLMLAPIGITELEERVYRALVRAPGIRSDQLEQIVGLGGSKLGRTLRSLEAKGLTSRVPGRPPRFVPTPPDLAVQTLISHRLEEIERARLAAQDLAEELRSRARHDSPVDVVEVVTGRQAVVQRFELLQRSAQHELLMFDRPPYARPVLNEIELELLERGIRYRVIYDSTALEYPGVLQWLDRLTAAGEEARVLPGVPMKLDIADRNLALVPLYLDEPGVEGGLLVSSSPLLEALIMLFETLWKRAVPVGPGRPPKEGSPSNEPPPDLELLLTLLAAGMKDEAIARQMGLSLRTVRRRIRNLMEELGAQTRYQAGLQVARRDWG